jgi:hypothetical protein
MEKSAAEIDDKFNRIIISRCLYAGTEIVLAAERGLEIGAFVPFALKGMSLGDRSPAVTPNPAGGSWPAGRGETELFVTFGPLLSLVLRVKPVCGTCS